MDSAETNDVTVECSRPLRVLVLAGMVGLLLVTLALIFAMAMGPLVLAKKFDIGFLLTAYLMFPVLIVFFAWCVWGLFRYREALFTAVRVSDSGILVQNSHYGVLSLSWDDVRATYSRMGKMVILESPKLLRPLAIMNLGMAEMPEFLAAKAIVQRSLGGRCKEQWLLP